MNRVSIGGKKARLALLAVSLATLSACSNKQEKAAEYLAQAAAQFQVGNNAGAREALIQANLARDDVPDQWLLLARIELMDRNLGQAYQAYTRVLELDTTNQEALQFVAQLGFQAGQIAEAEKAADRLLTINPTSTRAILIKGLIALDRKRTADAIKFAEQINRIDPRDEGGIVLRARALAISGDFDKALEVLKEAEARNGPSEGITATFLEIYRSQGDLANFIARSEKLLSNQPKNQDTKLDLANTYYKTGNPARARQLLVDYINTQNADSEALRKAGQLWAQYDPAPLAPSQFAEFAEKGTVAVRMLVARERLSRGAPQQAEAMLAPVAKSSDAPGLAEARALYARALDAMGQRAEAQAIVQAILEDDQNNADALLLSAQNKLRENNLGGAINDLQIVVRDHPENEEGIIALAKAISDRGDERRARALYENAIKDLPQSFAVMQSYVEFLYGIGDRNRAMSSSREFAQANPASIAGWKLYAQACERARNADCSAEAANGLKISGKLYFMDERPGTARMRGLFGRLR